MKCKYTDVDERLLVPVFNIFRIEGLVCQCGRYMGYCHISSEVTDILQNMSKSGLRNALAEVVGLLNDL